MSCDISVSSFLTQLGYLLPNIVFIPFLVYPFQHHFFHLHVYLFFLGGVTPVGNFLLRHFTSKAFMHMQRAILSIWILLYDNSIFGTRFLTFIIFLLLHTSVFTLVGFTIVGLSRLTLLLTWVLPSLLSSCYFFLSLDIL